MIMAYFVFSLFFIVVFSFAFLSLYIHYHSLLFSSHLYFRIYHAILIVLFLSLVFFCLISFFFLLPFNSLLSFSCFLFLFLLIVPFLSLLFFYLISFFFSLLLSFNVHFFLCFSFT